jgi:hypothetical protein
MCVGDGVSEIVAAQAASLSDHPSVELRTLKPLQLDCLCAPVSRLQMLVLTGTGGAKGCENSQ